MKQEFQVKVHFSKAEDAESKFLNVYEFLLSISNSVPANNQGKYEKQHLSERVS